MDGYSDKRREMTIDEQGRTALSLRFQLHPAVSRRLTAPIPRRDNRARSFDNRAQLIAY